MAIAFDNSAGSTTLSSSHTSKTYSHTCSGSDRIIIGGIGTFDSTGGNQVSGATYNGVALTELIEVSSQPNTYHSMWYLINPSTGTNNVSFTFSAQTFSWIVSASYTGVNQTSFPDASSSAGSLSGSSISGSVTTTVNNCWTVMVPFANAEITSAGAGTTLRVTSPTDLRIGIADSGAPVSPAGSDTLTVNCTNDNNAYIIASMAPFAAPSSTIKSIAGVTQANIKSVAGLVLD